ncbi:MAG: transposase [Planctomycetes bacterium]|nr:transposase [Planctomycetota bacterium]
MPEVLDSVEKDDLWIADRNFCTIGTMLSIDHDDAFFIIRQHKNTPFEEIDKPKYVGKSDGNSVYEHQVLIKDADGNQARIRRTIIKLKASTRDGNRELAVFSNLPKKAANAIKIMFLYKKRWTIETSFQHLEKNMNSEINSLGYPKAALFGFCIALVASNLFEVIYGTLRGLYGHEEIDDNFSSYYATSEMASVHDGMMLIVPEEDWGVIVNMKEDEFIAFLQRCSENINLKKYRKAKRGPKKPKPEKINKGEPHVST